MFHVIIAVEVNKIKNMILKLTELCPSVPSSLLLICRNYCGSFSMPKSSCFPESFDLLLKFSLYVTFWHGIGYYPRIISESNGIRNSRRISAILTMISGFFLDILSKCGFGTFLLHDWPHN
jgi:hypothetical protein